MDSKDGHLSLTEVTAAIRAMSPLDLKRLKLFALRFTWTGWDADDLLQEALLRMLDGRRHCRVGLPIAVALAGIVRSVASEVSEDASHVPLLELVPSHSEEETTKVPDQLRDDFSPERILSGRQDLAAMKALFSTDPPANAVFEGMLAGFEGAELSEVSDVAHSDLATVRKRIARRIGTTLLKGMER